MNSHTLFSQQLISSRGVGIGAYTAVSNDLSGIDWNPAGILSIRDWELMASNFITTGGERRTLGLYAFALGKQFLDEHAVGLRYSPGQSLEFLVPSTFQFESGSESVAFDKRISYRESYAIGYAFRPTASWSIGMSLRLRETTVSETEPSVEQDTLAVIKTVEYDATEWNVDLGVQYSPDPRWRIGLVARNLLSVRETDLPEALRPFMLLASKEIRGGISYSMGQSHIASIDVTTSRRGAVGMEWSLGQEFKLRHGLLFGLPESPFVDAVTGGIGWHQGAFRLDLSYIHFLNGAGRTNTTLEDFLSHGIEDIGYNRFTQNQFMVTLSVPLGRSREILGRIEQVQILSEVFPSSYQIHAYQPIGRAEVRNISDQPIDAVVSFYIEGFMDEPTETNAYRIPPMKEIDVPFTAVFNEAVRSISSMMFRTAEVTLKASPVNGPDDRIQTNVVFRGRNDWDGDVLSLSHFVTPDDPDILRFTRMVANSFRDSIARFPEQLRHFAKVSILFNGLAGRLVYIGDPLTSKDRVQFPSETLVLRGGDCDDISVCLAAMFTAVGIATAFVDVIPPGRPHEAHIYLLVDTGIPPERGELLTANSKRYVIRKNEFGRETLWIPIETTVTREGFEKAWDVGAHEYYQDIEMELGLAKGWVRIVDIFPR